MGWKSTIDITRESAIQEIIDCLDEASDEQISEALEALTPDSGHNYSIV